MNSGSSEPDAQPTELRVIPLPAAAEVRDGDDLASFALDAARRRDVTIDDSDVLVVTQKVVSKAEGRMVRLADVEPSDFARGFAAQYGKDARQVEVVLRETKRIVRMDRGVLVCETHHGLVCANAGVDASNVDGGETVSLLPLDSDASAGRIRSRLADLAGVTPAVIITDTFGRPWREGLTNVAIGAAGIAPIASFAGRRDPYGYELRVTIVAIVDEMASAAELVMAKTGRVPFALIRGFPYERSDGGAALLVRRAEQDLFR